MRMAVDLEPVQLVAADGSPTPERRYGRDLPAETLSWLYELMVITRELDAEFVNLKRQGELALFASCRGQEAAQIGAAACLRKTDWLFPQYRELGAFLVRGIPPGTSGPCGAEPGMAAWNSPRSAAPALDSDRHPDPARRGRRDGRATAGRRFGDAGLSR